MKSRRIYLSPPLIDEDDKLAVQHAMQSGWIAPVGPHLSMFEEELAAKFGYNHVLAVSSGTAALHLAVRLSGVGEGDKVIIGSFTFVAAANAVLYQNGEPIFIDSEEQTWNIDPELFERRLKKAQTNGESIKAVIITHLFGVPARIAEIQQICERYGVKLIEDAAEALGARWQNQHVGTFGDFAILSFNGNKIITTSGGGALICKDEADAKRARHLAEQAKDPAGHFEHSQLGYNYRLSNILAALGSSQLLKIEAFLLRKKEIYEHYKAHLPSDLFEFPDYPSDCVATHWLTTVLIKKDAMNVLNPRSLMADLNQQDIEAKRLWKPLHLQPLYAQTEYCGGKVSEDKFERGICLPSGVGLSPADQDRVIQALKESIASRSLLK